MKSVTAVMAQEQETMHELSIAMSIIELTVQQSERGQTFEELIDVVAKLKDELEVEGQSKGD